MEEGTRQGPQGGWGCRKGLGCGRKWGGPASHGNRVSNPIHSSRVISFGLAADHGRIYHSKKLHHDGSSRHSHPPLRVASQQ